MSRRSMWVLCAVLAGCASGPRPVPSSASPAERLALAEEAAQGAKGSMSFEIDAEGSHTGHFSGSLELAGGGALSLTAEGRFDRADARVELEALRGDINRSVTKGQSATSHHRAGVGKLAETLVVGMLRLGLLHSLVVLSNDEDLEDLEGGAKERLKVVSAREGGAEQVEGQPCHRVDFTVDNQGTKADATVCIADSTGLPLQRRIVVHFGPGDLSATEKYTWKLK